MSDGEMLISLVPLKCVKLLSPGLVTPAAEK